MLEGVTAEPSMSVSTRQASMSPPRHSPPATIRSRRCASRQRRKRPTVSASSELVRRPLAVLVSPTRVRFVEVNGYLIAPGAYLEGTNFEGADLTSANLEYAKLRGANLRGAKLDDANFRYADLTGANLEYAKLRGADLTGANLTGANLEYADLLRLNLYESKNVAANSKRFKRDPLVRKYREVKLQIDAYVPVDLTGANLTGAYLAFANLTGANLTDADLTSANLECANLKDANVTGAILALAELTDANFEGAYVIDADDEMVSFLPRLR
jgi:uncharacterized protein YjbI with pentapeptide repeats